MSRRRTRPPRELDTTRQQLGDLKSRAGYANVEEFQGVLDAIKKNDDKLNEKLTELRTKVAATVKEYKDNGGSDKKVEDLHNTVEQIITQYGNEPSKTFQSKLDRMTELMSSLTQLTVAMSLDNEALRHGLNTTNEVNQAKIDETDQARQKAEADLLDVTSKNEQGRTDLLARVDELQTANVVQANRIAGLENDLTRLRTQAETEKVDIINQLKYYREMSEQSDMRLDKPNGKILAVDYRRNEVRVSLTRKDGAREQMVFSVFDRNSPGLPTEHPKAVIELIRVGDKDSLARIDQVRTKDLLQFERLALRPATRPDPPGRPDLQPGLYHQDVRLDRQDRPEPRRSRRPRRPEAGHPPRRRQGGLRSAAADRRQAVRLALWRDRLLRDRRTAADETRPRLGQRRGLR